MGRSFRFAPPEARPDIVARPRLLRTLVGRWEHRITALTGGAGLGKTTLLSQAIAENTLAPRGEDHWVALQAVDADADRLARVVNAAVQRRTEADDPAWDQPVPEPAAVASAVWQRAPAEACIVLDDVHLLPPESTGATWLAALVEAMPANGHLVLASRSEPPLRLARLDVQGGVLRLIEDDLRFDDQELSAFAAQRGLDPGRFGDTGGWPAMAELVASVDRRVTGNYLWEEVLEPLGTMRRHVLAVLSDLGGADDDLISAAVGMPVDMTSTLDGVPLINRRRDGWVVPHGLWRSVPDVALPPSQRAEVRRRAALHLSERGHFDEAFTLLQETEQWNVVPNVLRRACLASDRLSTSQLSHWLDACTDSVRDSPAGQLAVALHTAFANPAAAMEPLTAAAARARGDNDADAEVTALAQLARLAWFNLDRDALDQLAARVEQLDASGTARARGLRAFLRALTADLDGDDASIIDALHTVESGTWDPAWGPIATFLIHMANLEVGDRRAAADAVAQLSDTPDAVLQTYVDMLRCRAMFMSGRLEEGVALIPGALERVRRTGILYYHSGATLYAAIALAHVGEASTARRYLDEGLTQAAQLSGVADAPLAAVASAMVQLAEGDEGAAAATMRAATGRHGLGGGAGRRAWATAAALTYVLLPESREHWDAAVRRGQRSQGTRLAAVVVALRDGHGEGALRELPGVDASLIRAALPCRFAAEVAVGLSSVGRAEGRALLEALGAPGRAVVRDLAATPTAPGRAARALLAMAPAAPRRASYLSVLGPLVLRRDGPAGEEVVDPDLRRKRVHSLLAYLVGHRRTTRSVIVAALWPDLDERSAANNLSVTLSRVRRLLEPWRDPGQPAYLLRLDGASVRLVTDAHLRIDIDEFADHLHAASRAEAEGVPSLALEHNLAAVNLYRGNLHAELADATWLATEREHYRARFVGAAVRAGQLLLGRGDVDQADEVARRALDVDEWSEDAYAVLVNAALARGDRTGARRLLDRCLDVLATLDVRPGPTIELLQRRISG